MVSLTRGGPGSRVLRQTRFGPPAPSPSNPPVHSSATPETPPVTCRPSLLPTPVPLRFLSNPWVGPRPCRRPTDRTYSGVETEVQLTEYVRVGDDVRVPRDGPHSEGSVGWGWVSCRVGGGARTSVVVQSLSISATEMREEGVISGP